jgi:predicted 3-demethylubiquinone-9 3-methyltransferase (glyoxalase superfamily)
VSTIAPCLWFDGTAEAAAKFYISIFPNSHIDSLNRAPADNPSTKAGEVLTVDFTLDGHRFIGLNGGPDFPFTEAISFHVDCADQADVDRFWNDLIADGGEGSACGWLKDRFGVSWQVVPRQLTEMLSSDDGDAAARAMEAMLTMQKIDIAQLQRAFERVPA